VRNTVGATNVWNNLTNGIAGNGGTISISDPLTVTARYYRLKVTLNP
jgi:hypothetical protein